MNTRCGICAGLRRPEGSESAPWDRVLFESEHFVAVPTRGAIVPGWVLLVPRNHVLCLAALPPDQWGEFEAFCAEVWDAVQAGFGPAAAFEHGPAAPNQRVGCGVDHAHLHIVPTACDLRGGAEVEFPGRIVWEPARALADAIARHRRGQPYLYVQQFREGPAWLGTYADLPSQLFRKVIARSVGRPDQFDWAAHPGHRNVAATVDALTTIAAAAGGTDG